MFLQVFVFILSGNCVHKKKYRSKGDEKMQFTLDAHSSRLETSTITWPAL